MAIKKNFIIEKRNVLNEIRANNMTIQELRFFSIYLSKINPRDINTRTVRFPMTDFQKIMEFGRLNMQQLSATTDSLLCKIVKVPNENGGFTKFQLFKECTVDMDKNGEWYIEIEAHNKALVLMFDFQKDYFTYKLWNALCLKSSNQLRMYEILKQYETAGQRIVSIDELKDLLGIDQKEYERFNNFKQWVLEPCQEALIKNTDIKFSYEPYGKRGKGGKIFTLRFTIEPNENYIDQLTLNEFIQQNNLVENEEKPLKFKNNYLEFFSEACDNEFSEQELQVLYNLVIKIIPYSMSNNNQIEYYNYLKKKYDELILRSSKTHIKNRFGYLKAIIEADLKEN